MGEDTQRLERAIEAIDAKKRKTAREHVANNPLITILTALLMGGSVSGVSVDKLWGGEQARAQTVLVVEAAEKAVTVANDQRNRAIDSLERCNDRIIEYLATRQ